MVDGWFSLVSHLVEHQQGSDLANPELDGDQTNKVGVQLLEDVPHSFFEHELLDGAHLTGNSKGKASELSHHRL